MKEDCDGGDYPRDDVLPNVWLPGEGGSGYLLGVRDESPRGGNPRSLVKVWRFKRLLYTRTREGTRRLGVWWGGPKPEPWP